MSEILNLGFTLVEDLRLLRVGSTDVRLTAAEYAVLGRMAVEPGAIVSVQELGDALKPGYADSAESNVLQVFVSRLRRKLAQAGAPVQVENFRGRGYRLAAKPAGGAP